MGKLLKLGLLFFIVINLLLGLSSAQTPVRLTNSAVHDQFPSWDPGSESIVYIKPGEYNSSCCGMKPNGLWVVQANASTPSETRILTGPNSTWGHGLGWSPTWLWNDTAQKKYILMTDYWMNFEYLKFDLSKAPYTRTVEDGADSANTLVTGIYAGGQLIKVSRDNSTILMRYSRDGGGGRTTIGVGPVASATG